MIYIFLSTVLYLIVILLTTSFYIVLDKKNKKIQIIDVCIIILLVTVTGIRYGIGTDYLSYYYEFNDIKFQYSNVTEILTLGYQFGFPLLNYILKSLLDNEYFIFWAVSIFVYPLLIFYMRKKTKIASIAFGTFMLMGFFDVSMNILKQQISMVLILFAYEYLIKKKFGKFTVLIAVAGTFHLTSILVGLLLVCSNFIKPTFKNLIISIITGIIGYFTYKFILFKVFAYNTIFSKYEKYLLLQESGEFDRQYRELSIIGYAGIFILLSIILLKYKEELKVILNGRINMISLLFIGITISIISIDYWVLNRIALYLYQFIITLIPALFCVLKDKKEKTIYFVFIVLMLISWFIFFVILAGNNYSYTYKTYLFK